MRTLSGQARMANGARTACYRVLLDAFCALIATVVLMMPAGLAAQQPGIRKADKKAILSCIATVQQICRQLPAYGVLSNGSVDLCRRVLTIVFRELLHHRAIGFLQKFFPDVVFWLETGGPRALPLFEIAHRAWEAWAGVECEYERALVKGGDRTPSVPAARVWSS